MAMPKPKPRATAPGALAALAASATLLAGCGGSGSEPAAYSCLGSSSTYLAALERAPGSVELGSGVPISRCLVPGQSGGELANIGSEVTVAATRLAVSARQGGAEGRQAALELGYLVGAARKGARRTGGIHADLIRRLESTARPVRGGVGASAYAEGLRAGLTRG